MVYSISHGEQLSVEKAKDLSSNASDSRFLVVDDPHGGSQDQISDVTRGERVCDPLLNFIYTTVKPRRNNTTLVESSVQLYDDLARAMVIDNGELADVSMLLHLS